MNFSKVHSAQINFLEAQPVDIEVDISVGLHAFNIIGLADKAIDEARDRVSAAIKNSGFVSPKQKNHKVTISLAPAHTKKNGPLFDVAIALGYLLSSRDIRFESSSRLFIGELALDGKIRPVRGVLPLAKFALENNFREIFVPKENAKEAVLISGIDVYGVENLFELICHLNISKKKSWRDFDGEFKQIPQKNLEKEESVDFLKNSFKNSEAISLSDICGQDQAKRGLLIAAAGLHNIALYGPPGTGKTMLAKAFSAILPPLSLPDILTVSSVHSVAGILDKGVLIYPPFRSPHHTSSYSAIIGGGNQLHPGEITLSHKGVLFLDEFPEFDRRVIESLRQPLEDGYISISRTGQSYKFPADILLIATMNPCPCGYHGSEKRKCTCLPSHILQYQRKISGPIVDRIDIWIEVDDLDFKVLSSNNVFSKDLENNQHNLSKKYTEDVIKARKIQKERYSGASVDFNSRLSAKEIQKYIKLNEKLTEILNQAGKKLSLSPRSYHKVIKLARTIADLDNSPEIKEEHLLEALQYRPKFSA